jgi:hypothetical protein
MISSASWGILFHNHWQVSWKEAYLIVTVNNTIIAEKL